jgi:NTE family protein
MDTVDIIDEKNKIKSIKLVESVESVGSVETIKSVESIKSVETVESVELIESIQSNDKNVFNTIILSGGSIKGICQLGALKYCIDNKIIDLKMINHFIGTSVGAVIVCFLSLGITIDHLYEFVLNLDFNKIGNIDSDVFNNFDKLITNYGLNNGSTIENYIEGVLTKTTNIQGITFKQLNELNNKKLTITGFSLQNGNKMFNHLTTPDLKVSLAIRISLSIPILFEPITLNNEIMIDGGFLDHYPSELIDADDYAVGFIVIENINKINTISNLEDYFTALYNICRNKIYELIENKFITSHNVNSVKIFTPTTGSFISDISSEFRQELFNIGFFAASNHNFL